MGQSGKKRYEKPTLKKVKLDAKCAVLGFCKVTGKIGPGRTNCGSSPAVRGGQKCLFRLRFG